MKKIIFIIFLSFIWIGLFAQQTTIDQIPPGGTWQNYSNKANANFQIISDSLRHLKTSTDQNFGFIDALQDSVGDLRDAIEAIEIDGASTLEGVDSVKVFNDQLNFYKDSKRLKTASEYNTHNILDYGAISGDEVSDVAAIQAAIDSAYSTITKENWMSFNGHGAEVIIPAGRWVIDDTVILRSGVNVKFSPAAVVEIPDDYSGSIFINDPDEKLMAMEFSGGHFLSNDNTILFDFNSTGLTKQVTENRISNIFARRGKCFIRLTAENDGWNTANTIKNINSAWTKKFAYVGGGGNKFSNIDLSGSQSANDTIFDIRSDLNSFTNIMIWDLDDNALPLYCSANSYGNNINISNLKRWVNKSQYNNIYSNGQIVSKSLVAAYSQDSALINNSGDLYFRKDKHGETAAGRNVVFNDLLGSIRFQGWYDDGYYNAARIKANVFGTPSGTNGVPGSLTFMTKPASSEGLKESLLISPTYLRTYVNFLPNSTASNLTLGNNLYRWASLWMNHNGNINWGDNTANKINFTGDTILHKLTLTGADFYTRTGGLYIGDTAIIDYIKEYGGADMNEVNDSIDAKIGKLIDEGVEGLAMSDTIDLVVTRTQLEGALNSLDLPVVGELLDNVSNLKNEVINIGLELENIYDILEGQDLKPPRFVSAEINEADKDLLVITMDKNLFADSIPADAAFLVKENGGTVDVTGVALDDDKVKLTLERNAKYSYKYSVSYTKPEDHLLQDANNNKVASFKDKPVTNNIEPVELLNGLQAYWKLDESVGDFLNSVRNENNLNYISGVTRSLDGKIGDAISYTSKSGYVRVDPTEAFIDSIMDNGEMTYSILVNLDTLSSEIGREQKLLFWRVPTHTVTFNFTFTADNRVMMTCTDQSVNRPNTYTATNALSKHQWYHIVFTVKAGGDMTIWIDGVKDTNHIRQLTSILRPTGRIILCSDQDNAFVGRFQHAAIWNRVLTDSEISELFGFYDNNIGYPFVSE